MELKTARLTVLLDPSRKREFERVCRENDMTPSQVLRHLIRDYLDTNAVPRRGGRLVLAASSLTQPVPVRKAAARAPVQAPARKAARR